AVQPGEEPRDLAVGVGHLAVVGPAREAFAVGSRRLVGGVGVVEVGPQEERRAAGARPPRGGGGPGTRRAGPPAPPPAGARPPRRRRGGRGTSRSPGRAPRAGRPDRRR